MIVSKTPVRIAFGGGGTDVEPYPRMYGGFVVNATITKYFRTIVSKNSDQLFRIYSDNKFTSYKFKEIKNLNESLPLNDIIKATLFLLKPNLGLDFYIHGKAPKKAGLGASASLSCSLIAGILKVQSKQINLSGVAEKAYKVEDELLENVGGRQDQYSTLFGGFNCITFSGGKEVDVDKLKISSSFRERIEKNLILYYTGIPHTSGNLVKKQVDFFKREQNKAKKFLDQIKEIAYMIRDSLKDEEFERFGELLSEDLKVKKRFNPLIMNEEMNKINKGMIKKGVIGGRVCGAGGGGSMIWLCNPKRKNHPLEFLNKQNGSILEYNFEDKGLDLINI